MLTPRNEPSFLPTADTGEVETPGPARKRPAPGFAGRLLAPAVACAMAPWLHGAIWHVAPTGDDGNPGTEQAPWRTIGKGVAMAQPGDTVVVHSGTYPERITTLRGGTSATNRITFRAVGRVEMRGWVVNHPFITVEGFDITGHATASVTDAYVRVNNGGSFFELVGCTIRDGIGIKRDDIVFIPPNQIQSGTGGFAEAGFRPGHTIQVARGTNIAVNNAGTFVLADVTDTVLTLTNLSVQAEGPKPVYITASAAYGVLTAGGTQGCVLRSNRFSNLSFDFCFLQGVGHRLEFSVFERNNGWDILFWAGTNHVIQGNWFRDSGWGIYDPSPDIFDNWPIRYENIFFTNNFIMGFLGVINAQKRNATVSGPLFIRQNVFVDVGWLSVVMPHTHLEQNTFVRAARRANVAVQRERHPVIVDAGNYATNSVIRNNVFVDCGEPAWPVGVEGTGWYEIRGDRSTIVTEGNFVAGAPPTYGAKTNWTEAPELNGGDPGFVNIDDPLGPDGLPFTADDGLRPRADSRLVGAGVGGVTIGAYELPYVERVALDARRVRGNTMQVRWPRSIWNWTLEWAPDPGGPWEPVPVAPSQTTEGWELVLPAEEPAKWFRLRR